jgi:perosamine synthetase
MDKKKILEELFKEVKKTIKCDSANLHEPLINNDDLISVKKCLKSGFVSYRSEAVNEFEKKISQYTKSKYVIATSTGTSALQLSYLCQGVKFKDEILMPSINFVAAANAAIYCNAIPHFVDVEKDFPSIDYLKLKGYLIKNTVIKKGICINKKTKRIIRALVFLHPFGLTGNIIKIKSLCKSFKIKIIEDAAESIGSFYKGKHLGTFADVGILSFNGNKTITTGGGGAILTSNKKIAEYALFLSTTAKKKNSLNFEFGTLGYNFRMPGINAALGLSQLKKLNNIIKLKRKLFNKYKVNLKNLNHIKLLSESKLERSNYWLISIMLDKNNSRLQKDIVRFFNDKKYYIRPIWKPLHQNKHLRKFPKMNLKNTNSICKRIINLPSSPSLTR